MMKWISTLKVLVLGLYFFLFGYAIGLLKGEDLTERKRDKKGKFLKR